MTLHGRMRRRGYSTARVLKKPYSLNANEQLVWIYRTKHKFSRAVVAAKLGLKVETVDTLLCRARKKQRMPRAKVGRKPEEAFTASHC